MFLYKLECEGLVLYVGKTVDMKERYYKHCCRKDTSGSREIPHDMVWSMVLLEDCEDILGTSREQYYFDTLKPLYNKCRPGQTQLEYKRSHPEQRREINRRYHEAHRETHNAKSKEGMRRHYAKNKDAINARRREIARAKKQLSGVAATQSQEDGASSAPPPIQQH